MACHYEQTIQIKGEEDQEFGPVSADELRSWIGQNRCNLNTLVEADGSGNWVKLVHWPSSRQTLLHPN